MYFSNTIPIEFYKKNLLNSIKKFQITIIQAETGSGKTIFVPKIIYMSNLYEKIIITQTKRAAAIKSASFLSNILNENLGDRIGYSVRFENKTKKNTQIKFMTDGILFQKLINNFFFEKNTCIILDEFHERTVYTDLLICMLKQTLVFRKDLKLIFMSASGNSFKLAEYFREKIGKIDIPGSLYKIKTFFTKYPQLDFIISLCSLIVKFHINEKLLGDFLVFLPGYGEIIECEKMLKFLLEKKFLNFSVCKLHSNLPLSEQLFVFDLSAHKKRKIILSTNIAESSLTIKRIKFVFDSGFSKQKILNWKTGLDLFKISSISKSEAKQRAGRAGRTQNGKCFRLFTYIEYSKFPDFPRPEIQRSDLDSFFLQVLTSKFSALFSLDFIDVPPSWIVKRALENLFILGAIDNKIKITKFGRLLSLYPIEIKLSKCIIESLKTKNEKIKNYIILSTSMLSLNFDFCNLISIQKITENGSKNKYLKVDEECLLMALFLKEFLEIKTIKEKFLWCKYKNVNIHTFELASNIKSQLLEINILLDKHFFLPLKIPRHYDNILSGFRYCLTSGFFQNSSRILRYSRNLQIITTGILINLNKFNVEKIKTNNLFLFYEILISYKISLKGLESSKLSWILFFGGELFI